MKRKYIPLLLATTCTALLATACTHEDAATATDTRHQLQLDFSLATDAAADRQARTIINGTSLTRPVGIYLSRNSDNAAYPGGTGNGKYTYSYSRGSWSSNEAIYLYGETANVHAFYPSTPAVTRNSNGKHTIPATVPAVQTFDGSNDTGSNATDYLYGLSGNTAGSGLVTADSQGNNSSTPVSRSIYLHHALCKVVFNLQYAQSRLPDAGNDYIKAISLKANSFRAGTGTMQLTDGTLSLPAASELTFRATADSEKQPGTTGTPATVAYGLAAPLNAAPSSVTLSVTLGARGNTNNDRTFSVTSNIFNVAWEAGKTYTYHLTLDNVGIGVQSTTITGWTPQGSTSTLPPEGFAAKVKAEIAGSSVSATPRAVVAGSAVYDRDRFYEGDQILITQLRNGKTATASYTCNASGAWSTAKPLYVQPETTYRGRYPVNYDGIRPDQSQAENFRLSNLLETKAITPTDQWLEFTGTNAFGHTNSRVTLQFILEQSSSSTPTLRVSGQGLHSGGSNTETVTFFQSADKEYTAIVAPGISRDLSVTLTLGGISYPATLTCARTAGTHYTYTLTVQNNTLVPLSEEIKGWGEGETINGDLKE